MILTSRHDRHAEGRLARQPRVARPGCGAPVEDPAEDAAYTVHVAAPLFHSWGFAHFSLGLILGIDLRAAAEVRPRGSASPRCARTRADALAVVPVMMQRILELPEETIAKYDTSSLKVVAASGSALPGDLATRWMDEFGDTLYNLYGSTEVAWATIATPADMRAAPGTAGRPPRGTVVRLYDEQGRGGAAGRRPAASSSATRCCSRATRAAARRT